MATIASLNFFSKLNTKDFDASLKKTSKKSQNFVQKLQANFKKLAAAAGAGAVFGAVAAAAKKAAEDGNRFAKMSDKVRVSVESLSLLESVAESTGTNMDAVSNTLFRMNRRIGNFQTETGPAARAMKELGFSAHELDNLTVEQKFFKIVDSLNAMDDATRATQMGYEILGDNFKDLRNMTNLGSDGIQDMMKHFKSLGHEMSTEQARDGEVAAQSYADMNKSIMLLSRNLGELFVPTLKLVSEGIQSVVNWMNKWQKAAQKANAPGGVLGPGGVVEKMMADFGFAPAAGPVIGLQGQGGIGVPGAGVKFTPEIEKEESGITNKKMFDKSIPELKHQIMNQEKIIEELERQNLTLAPLPTALGKGTSAQLSFINNLKRDKSNDKILQAHKTEIDLQKQKLEAQKKQLAKQEEQVELEKKKQKSEEVKAEIMS
tara:strand:+ start:1288 stop:2583 length:1296 start_codon:yes stop_codon:yes gene_type:complete